MSSNDIQRAEGRFSRLSHLFKESIQVISPGNSQDLCKNCKGISFSQLREGQPYAHGNFAEVLASAEAGCVLCSLLKSFKPLQPPQFSKLQLFGVRKQLSSREKECLIEEGDIENIGVYEVGESAHMTSSENYSFNLQLALQTDKNDVTATSIKRRPFIEDFESDAAYNLMKQWIDNCIFHHAGCRTPIISRLPTRVLDVGPLGGRQDPFLFVPPVGFEDSYVALSYCWGSTLRKFALTKEKAQMHRPSFPLNSLPKTLRHAVHITRRLGFRYLWIDSLCIIQEGDRGEDFQKESDNMREVYGNATITIAAAAAESVEDGIFRRLPPNDAPKCQMSYGLVDGSIGTVMVESEKMDFGSSREAEPWNTRAWTLQERILSHRVIIFYKDQLAWDCASTLINANGPLNPRLGSTKDTPGRYSDFVGLNDHLNDTTLTLYNKYMIYWRHVVEYYARRQLSYENDKLNALAGLARLIASKTDDSYIAGLWQSDIHRQLMWDPSFPIERPKEYRAPSWSWASLNSEIRFLREDTFENNQSKFEILEIKNILVADSNRFGEIKEASLVIKGQLRREVPYSTTTGLDKGEFYYLNAWSNGYICWGLILEKTAAGQFRRAGKIVSFPSYCFDNIKPEIITLV